MSVSHSELACFRRCPREHFYRYTLRRESRVTSKALVTGKKIDKAIKSIWLHSTPDLEGFSPAERAMVLAYEVRWRRSTLVVEQTDVPFRVKSGDVEVVGELDAVGMDNGRRVLIELKTTSEDISPGSGYWRRIVHMDPQVTIYLNAAKSLGWDASFLVYDVIKKPLLRQKTNEVDGDFEIRILEDIAKRPENYYWRAEIVRFEGEHEAHVRDIGGMVRLKEYVSTMAEAPRNVDSCFKFNRACDYLDVCTGEAYIEDDTRFQDREKRKFDKEEKRPQVSTPRTYSF